MNRFRDWTLFLVCALSASLAVAGLQGQLDAVYLDMENYTAPGAYETQRRGAYFGGRYTYKTRIFDENLVAMSLPSARGGCGGIDIFGGSFSFVNSDQLVQLLRAVAANAKGYAFQLAMDNMCPDCIKWMNELQSKMQDLNANLSNSCQLAQGIINDTTNLLPFKVKEKTNHSITASLKGVGEDFVDLAQHITTADTAVKRLFDADPTVFDDSTGAVVFKALKQHGAESWFQNGDDELLESIMSMSGTVVVGDLMTGSEGEGQTTRIWVLPGNKLTMEDLIEGVQDASLYDCSRDTVTEHCRIAPSDTQTVDLNGLKQKILDAFTGPDGLIDRIRNARFSETLGDTQQSVMAAAPHALASKIFLLAKVSPEAAEQLVRDSIDTITLEYIHQLVSRSFDAVEVAMANHENTYKSPSLHTIEQSRQRLDEEYGQLAAQFGSLREIEAHYNNIILNLNNPLYAEGDTQQGNQPE